MYFQIRNISIDGKQPTLNAANLVWDLRDVSPTRVKGQTLSGGPYTSVKLVPNGKLMIKDILYFLWELIVKKTL